MSAEQRILSVRAPRATRNEESPPRQPPVVTPFKGRNFVQASETGPAFLDPFNSEPAIEPTGPPNSLTTIPTAKDKPVKKRSTGQVSIAKESGPKAVGPKVTDPVTPQTPSNPPQLDEGPKKLDAVEGQDLGSDISKGEQPTVSIPALGPGPKLKQSRRRKLPLNRGELSLVGLMNSQTLGIVTKTTGHFLPYHP